MDGGAAGHCRSKAWVHGSCWIKLGRRTSRRMWLNNMATARSGFHALRPAPEWLADIPMATIEEAAMKAIPMARIKSGQRNPIYNRPPEHIPVGEQVRDQMDGSMPIKKICRGDLGERYKFIYAVITLEDGHEGFVNLHGIDKMRGTSTMYCAVSTLSGKEPPQTHGRCLCGHCKAEWMSQGWICSWIMNH